LASPRALSPALAFLRAYLTVTATEEVQQEAIIAKVVEHLGALIKLLAAEENPRTVLTPSGSAVAFGLGRLSVLEFLLALNRINNPTLDAAFQQHKFFNLLLDVLFRQSTSSIVHDLVAQAFFAAFNRPESFIHSVIQSTDLMQVILDKWAYYEKANAIEEELLAAHPDLAPLRYLTHITPLDRFPEEIREKVGIVREVRAWSFVGHLANLANLVAGLAKHGEGDLKSYIESNDKWTTFVDGHLKDYNAKSNVTHPPSQWSIDSESNEGQHHQQDDDDDSDEDSDGEGNYEDDYDDQEGEHYQVDEGYDDEEGDEGEIGLAEEDDVEYEDEDGENAAEDGDETVTNYEGLI